MKKYKKITPKIQAQIENIVSILLEASLTSLHYTREFDGRFSIIETSYCEAFGVMQGLAALGYGYFGTIYLDTIAENKSDQDINNLNYWFFKIRDEVLKKFLMENP